MFAERNAAACGGADNLTVPHGAFYSFIPVVASSIANADPYTLTAYGNAFGFTAAGKAYINECCTHNSFGLTGGLNIIDFDSAGHPTTLAGNFRIRWRIAPVPEPVTMSMPGGRPHRIRVTAAEPEPRLSATAPPRLRFKTTWTRQAPACSRSPSSGPGHPTRGVYGHSAPWRARHR